MNLSKTKKMSLVCCAVAVVLLLVPTTTQACEWLDRLMPWNWCCGSDAAASTYAPAYAAQYPVATQTCCYVPQTSYRTVMRTVPTTVYRPTTYCDPCTGCPTTCYSPMTSYVRSAQLVPYTTYTPVWTTSCCSPCCPTNCSTGCGTSCDSGYTTTTAAGCGSCGTPAAPSTLVPTPAQGTTTPSSPGAAQPSLPSGTSPPPYKQNKPISPSPEEDIRESSHNGPQLDGPSFDRTATRPVQQAAYRAVSYKSSGGSFEYGGWRAAGE